MGESGAAAFQFGQAEARARGVEPEELREALGLVQESVIKLLRFQLAMERRDRRVAMEVMDDVVLLERRLNAIVTRLPESPAAAAHPSHRADLDAARSLLAREKFTLAAGAPGAARSRQGNRIWKLGPKRILKVLPEMGRRRWMSFRAALERCRILGRGIRDTTCSKSSS